MKELIFISSYGITQRLVRMRVNLPYYGIARRALRVTDPLVEAALNYHRDIDISAILLK